MTDRVSSHHQKPRLTQSLLRHLSPILWALVILWLSLTSKPPEVPGMFGWDKLLHAGAYGLLAILLAQLLLLYDENLSRIICVTSAACIIYGGLVEILQLYGDAGRTAEWLDLFADAVGIALACVIFRHGYALKKKYACDKGQFDG